MKPRTFSCLALGSVAATVIVLAHSAVAAPPATDSSLAHPPANFTALPLAQPRSATFRRSGEGSGRAPGAAPLSEAERLPDGSRVFSYDVNRILCVSERGGSGDAPGRETWLGTRFGVRCLDRKHNVVRHYTEADGLPGRDVEAIVAADAGVWCLVSERGSTALCAWDEKTGRWSVLQEFSAPHSDVQGNWFISGGRGGSSERGRFLAVADDPVHPRRIVFVVAAPVPSAAADTPLAVVFDVRTGRVQSIPWEAALRADHPAIAVNALAVDAAGLWLGTDIGLLRYPFAALDVREGGLPDGERWQRFLPACAVDALAVDPSAGSAAVYALDHLRSPSSGTGGERFAGDLRSRWNLHRVSLPASPAAAAVASASDAKIVSFPPPLPGGAADGRPAPPEDPGLGNPEAVCVAADGSVWTSHRGSIDSMGNEATPFGSMGAYFGPNANFGGWERLDPKIGKWTTFPLRRIPLPVRPVAFDDILTGIEITAPDSIASGGGGTLPLDAVPTAAILPLALLPPPPPDPLSQPYDLREPFWLTHRFPEWLCPDDTRAVERAASAGPGRDAGAIPAPFSSSGTSVLATQLTQTRSPWLNAYTPPLPDPADPDRVWMVDPLDQTLIRLPKDKVPPPRPSPRPVITRDASGRRIYTPPPKPAPLTGKGFEPFPFPENLSVQQTPVVNALEPMGDNLMVISEAGLRRWDDRRGEWRPLFLPSGIDPIVHLGRKNVEVAVLPDGPDSMLFCDYRQGLLRFDPATGITTPLPPATQPPSNTNLVARSPDGGIWMEHAAGTGSLLYLPPEGLKVAADAPAGSALIAIPPPPAQGPAAPLGATGHIAWFRTTAPSGSATIVGYDVSTKTWTAPLTLSPRSDNGEDPVILPEGPGGEGCLIAGSEDGAAAAVWRYDRAADAWSAAAPGLPTPTSAAGGVREDRELIGPNLLLVGGDARSVTVLARGRTVYRYNRIAKRWEAPVPLPPFLEVHSSSLYEICAAQVGDAVFVGKRDGLYRVALPPLPPAADKAADTAAAAPAKTPEWMPVLEPVTLYPWQTYALENGNRSSTPSVTTPERERAVWSHIVVTPTHVYGLLGNGSRAAFLRLDRKTGRWTAFDAARGFPDRLGSNPRLIADGTGVFLLHSSGAYRLPDRDDRWHLLFRATNDPASNADMVVPPAAEDGGGGGDKAPLGDVVDIAVTPPPSIARPKGKGKAISAPVETLLLVNLPAGVGDERRYRRDPTLWQSVSDAAAANALTLVTQAGPLRRGRGAAVGNPTGIGASHGLLRDAGGAWVGTDLGLFFVPLAPIPVKNGHATATALRAPYGDVWQSVALPPALGPLNHLTALAGDPAGGKGLWIVGDSGVVYWATAKAASPEGLTSPSQAADR